jgi:arylsulfatase A-like enzyme
MLALYDGEIAYADAQLGRFLGALAERGELDQTLVILTSDHGEGLGAHGYYYDHGSFLYDEELHVPLILRLPGKAHAGTRVAGLTRLLDLAPTVLELCGVAAPAELSGTSLIPLLSAAARGAAGIGADEERLAFAHSEMAGDVSSFALLGRRLALRTARFKLIWTSPHWRDTERVAERYELYDLARDPGEQTDLAHGAPAQAAPLWEQLERWRDAMQSVAETGALAEDVREHLRALGYL